MSINEAVPLPGPLQYDEELYCCFPLPSRTRLRIREIRNNGIPMIPAGIQIWAQKLTNCSSAKS